MLQALGLIWPIAQWLLKNLGIAKDPEQEKEYKLKLIELAAAGQLAEAEEFQTFLKATTPDANRVYVWANTWIAITRPAITWLIVLAIIFAPDRLGTALKFISEAGTVGMMLMSIPLWWFFGRDMAKMFAKGPINGIISGAVNGNGNGSAPVVTPVDAPTDRVAEGMEYLRKFDEERNNAK